MAAKARYETGKIQKTATADVAPGTLEANDGVVGIVEGLSGGSEPGVFKAGDDYMVNCDVVIEVDAPSTLTGGLMTPAYVNLSSQGAIASGGGGAVLAGRYYRAKTAGQTTALIWLNAPGYDA